MGRARLGLALLLAVSALATGAAGCHRDGCVGGDDGQCVPPPACGALAYPICAAPRLRAEVIGDMDGERALGPKALAAAGDYLLENDLVRVVLDAPDHPHHLAPSGGAILDLAALTPNPDNPNAAPQYTDQTNAIYHAAGVLPRDAVHYESATPLFPSPGSDPAAPGAYAAVIFRGHLEGNPKVTVVTRYEVRPCEPGVRVRTDLYNGASDPNTLFLADGFFWGDNGLVPFVPGQGLGFVDPNLDLLHLDQAWREWPFVAARSQSVPDTSYAAISCDRSQSAGFNSTTLTAAGVPLGVTLPGDGFHFERFILAEYGSGVAPAVGEAMHVRTLVHGDPPAVNVSGRVVANGAPVDGRAGRGASLLFYEPAAGINPDDPNLITPRNEVAPDSNGMFQVALPPNRTYRVQAYAFGLPAAAPVSFAVAQTDASIGDVTITASARLMATVESSPGIPVTYAELVVIPIDNPAATNAPVPSLYGLFPGCLNASVPVNSTPPESGTFASLPGGSSPMLGPPDGASPACNRALTQTGGFDLRVPPGQYYVYATQGPFSSIDVATVNLLSGETTQIALQVQSLAALILPSDVISGDFHVHGGASFDSGIPDIDRVVSFLATGVDVVIATDHNVVTSYAGLLATLAGASSALGLISGVEQTPNILWYYVPGETFPKTLGHFNFWPLAPDLFATRNGAPWAELVEPGQLMDEMDGLFQLDTAGVRQLNHPYQVAKLGRDQGYAKAIGYDPTTPIPKAPADGYTFAANALARTPPDPTTGGPGRHQNMGWDVEEVMTGASRADWLRYRALWFSLLNQGFLHAGTANSDSHSLSVERIGYPRNLVWGKHDKTNLGNASELTAFDDDVRAGHLEGTNGPFLDVNIDDGTGTLYRSDLRAPITTLTPAATLNVTVTAAPWIPVDEVRVFVNGVERPIPVDQVRLFSSGVQVENTFQGTDAGALDVSSKFLAGNSDHLSITPNYTPLIKIPLASLLPGSGDAWIVVEAGMTQTTPPDTDGDGLPDLPGTDVPMRVDGDERFDVEAIAPGVWPTAFTNPFLLDLDGGGWTAPGLQ
jgi:hypothetical protein